MMCPEGAFGLALESSARIAAPTPAKGTPTDRNSAAGGARLGAANSLFKLFVWGAPR
jgi:hypothetical protein